MMLPYFWNRSHPLNALVSLHHDGRMIAGLLEKFGMGTIGGSSTENGKNAALELMRSLQKGEAIAIIPDGPKGPSMTLSRSAVYFAQNRENRLSVPHTVLPAPKSSKRAGTR